MYNNPDIMSTSINFDDIVVSAVLHNNTQTLDVLDMVQSGSPLDAQLDSIFDNCTPHDYAADPSYFNEGEDPQAVAIADEVISAMPQSGCNFWSDSWTDDDESRLEAELDRIFDNCLHYAA